RNPGRAGVNFFLAAALPAAVRRSAVAGAEHLPPRAAASSACSYAFSSGGGRRRSTPPAPAVGAAAGAGPPPDAPGRAGAPAARQQPVGVGEAGDLVVGAAEDGGRAASFLAASPGACAMRTGQDTAGLAATPGPQGRKRPRLRRPAPLLLLRSLLRDIK